MHLLLTRPDAGADPDPLQTALGAAGHRIAQAPMLTVEHIAAMPPLDGVQALIATSRNGLKAVAPIPESARRLPLFAVGPATAALGRALGFTHVIEGPGTGRELADIIRAEADPAAGTIVHIAGETLAFDLEGALGAQGFKVRTEVVYRTEPTSGFPPEVADAFGQGAFDGVVLMSPRTAKVYAQHVADAGLAAAARRMVHFCLSDAVARQLASLGVERVAVARAPNSEEMLALIAGEASDSPK
jgi:uroporphyrinogen-III synthase